MPNTAIGNELAMDDRTLVAGVLAGNPDAERRMYDTHVDRVFRLAYRLTGDEELAREFTQDAFVRAFDRLATFRGEAKLSTWLCSVATSVVFNGLRKIKRIRSRQVELDMVTVADERRTAEPDLKERLQAAIDDLPQGYRAVFLMHDVEGYTHEEIAEAMGIQPGTSKAQLSRARAKLRVALAAFAGGVAS